MGKRRTPAISLPAIVVVALFVVQLAACGREGGAASEAEAGQPETGQMTSGVHWLGHDSFRIEGDGLVVYIDPWKLQGGVKADLILITHDHPDHCSPADVAKIQEDDTVIVTVAAAASKLSGEIEVVRPGDTVTVKGVPVSAVPAYNLNKYRSPGVPYHPQDSDHVGFVLTLGGKRIYHAGDTDHIPRMASIEADVALLPVSGIYVMTAEEAAEAAAAIRPAVAVPMHVGRDIGSLADAERFSELAPVHVEVLAVEE